MTEPLKETRSARSAGGAFPSLLVSRWFYRALLSLLILVGTAFVAVGLARLADILKAGAKSDWIGSGIVYTSVGLLVLLAAFGLHQLRVFFRSQAKSAAESIATRPDEDEEFDRLRRAREERAQRDFERNLTASVMVEHLEARDLSLFQRLEWDLQPGVNVLLGRNGYGKSLILRALAGLLQRDEEATDLLFTNSAESADPAIEVRLKRDGEKFSTRRNALRFVESVGKIPILAIPDSRFLDRSQQVVGPDENNTSDLRTYGAYHFLYQRPYVSVIQGLLYGVCLDYWEHGRRFDLPVFQFFEDCVRRLTGYDFRFHSINRSGRTGFEIRVLTEGNPEPLPIQFASQGTLSVIAMFGLIRSYLQEMPDKSGDALSQSSAIVLIDEADAHLHPVWQQKVPSLLKDLFPKVQFILTAHSPLFVAGCWRGEVAVLRRIDPRSSGSGFKVEQLDRDFVGATPAELYKEIFEVEELDATYLEYATKATLRTEHSKRINELGERRESKGLSPSEEEEFLLLTEESRRIRRAIDVKARRRQENEKVRRIDELESEILKLKSRIATGPEERLS